LKLTEWQNTAIDNSKRLFEDGGGASGGAASGAGATVSGSSAGGPTTDSSNIGYIPSEIGRSDDELKRLAKKKRKWNVKTEQTANERVLNFEDYKRFIIKETDWDLFQRQTFGKKLKEFKDFTADLTPFLNEALDEELAQAQQELKHTVVSLLNSELLSSQRHKIASFVKAADQQHLNFSEVGQCVFSEPDVSQQLSHFLSFVDQAYKNDLGSIQLLTNTILNGEPLQGLPLFSKFDNLTGTSISGYVSNDPIAFSSSISFDYRLREKLIISNPMILKKLSPMTDKFKVDGNTLYPVSGNGFPTNIFSYIWNT
jgi:hypothetical protein